MLAINALGGNLEKIYNCINPMFKLLYLKFAVSLSDEKLVARRSENVIWQYFRGRNYYTPELPCDAN
ncbi:MAG: Mobile element protein [Marmoricola sp.]|nr:Mobile element protein [Marmoricola sp.]